MVVYSSTSRQPEFSGEDASNRQGDWGGEFPSRNSEGPERMHSLSPEFRWLIGAAPPAQRVKRHASIDRLQELGIHSYAELGQVMGSLSGPALIAAIDLVSDLDREVAVPALLRLCSSPDPETRGYALSSLEHLGGKQVARAFAEHLNTNPDPWVREKAAHGLGFLFDGHSELRTGEPSPNPRRNWGGLPRVLITGR